MFATCFYGLLNLKTGEFVTALPAITLLSLRTDSGEVEAITEVGGIPLGLFDGMGYLGSTLQLHPGDSLFLYTDGVPEAQNIAKDDLRRARDRLSHPRPRTGCRDLIPS